LLDGVKSGIVDDGFDKSVKGIHEWKINYNDFLWLLILYRLI
jgi:hypothetical protein